MATTTMGQPTTDKTNRGVIWGIAIAALVILAIIFATRAARNNTADNAVGTGSVASDTYSAPAASTATVGEQFSDTSAANTATTSETAGAAGTSATGAASTTTTTGSTGSAGAMDRNTASDSVNTNGMPNSAADASSANANMQGRTAGAEGYNVDNGTMDLNNQPNDRLTTPNAANPNSTTQPTNR